MPDRLSGSVMFDGRRGQVDDARTCLPCETSIFLPLADIAIAADRPQRSLLLGPQVEQRSCGPVVLAAIAEQ